MPDASAEYLGPGENDRLASLVLTLAGEVVLNRQRILRLEAALTQLGGTRQTLTDVEASIGGDVKAAAQQIVDRMLHVMTENEDPDIPLRSEWLESVRGGA